MKCNVCGKDLKNGERAYELSSVLVRSCFDSDAESGQTKLATEESQWVFCGKCYSGLDLDGKQKARMYDEFKELYTHLGELLIGMNNELDLYKEASEAHKRAFKLMGEIDEMKK